MKFTLSIAVASLVAFTLSIGGAEEFVGPFGSWVNVKTVYGAKGDGATDDTAAIQGALDQAGVGTHSPVVYFPAGTYRISQTLRLAHTINIHLVGQDPANTILRWSGTSGGTMLNLNGVAYSKISRFTFDGQTSAGIAVDQSWDGTGVHFDTGNEYSDDYFIDAGFGIHGGFLGYGFAETSVERCHFIRTSYGIAVGNFNALDLWVWYSLFDHCQYGVTNTVPSVSAAGNYHVYNSVFRNSSVTDFGTGNTAGFSARGNYSSGSRRFFDGGGTGNPAPISIQKNTIVDPTDPSVIVQGNEGPGFIVDNVIRSLPGSTGPAVYWAGFTDSDVTLVGNTFTISQTAHANGRLTDVDNQIVSAASLNLPEPVLPGAPLNLNRQVFEVAPGADADAIQQAINAAAAKSGSRPVVHLPFGSYSITKTLVFPASDIQLVGDGFGDYHGSFLRWAGTGQGPVIALSGPSHVTFRDIEVNANSTADGIIVYSADQPGSRIYMDQTMVLGAQETNLLVNGLDQTNVQLENFQYTGGILKMLGGSMAAAGLSSPGKVNIFSAASCCNNVSYDISGGARVLVRDIWYESGRGPGFAHVHGKATFTTDGTRLAATVGALPAFDIVDLDGQVTVLEADLDDRLVASGDGTKARVAMVGTMGERSDAGYFSSVAAPAAQTLLLNSRQISSDPSHRSQATPNAGSVDPAFIRRMLAQTRQEDAAPVSDLSSGVTDARFFRVRVVSGVNNIALTPNLNLLPPVPSAPGSQSVDADAGLSAVQIYPNPWRQDKNGAHAQITFDSLPLGTTVKIFTLSGRLIKTLTPATAQASWTLTNAAGDKAASGLYVYLLTDPNGHKRRGKLAVIR